MTKELVLFGEPDKKINYYKKDCETNKYCKVKRKIEYKIEGGIYEYHKNYNKQ